MQVRSEGGVGVGADVDGVIGVIILRDNDPLGNGELLFQETNDGLLILPSEGGGMLMRTGLIHGPACGNYGGDESLLLSLRGSCGGLSHSRSVILLPLSSGGGGLLFIEGEVGCATRHGWQYHGD
jgi:hypothetical protein